MNDNKWQDERWLFGWAVGTWVWLAVWVVVIVGFLFFSGRLTSGSEPPGRGPGETAAWFLESDRVGTKAGYEDCENHRYHGATFNASDWHFDSYKSGYNDGYNNCEGGRKAYEEGLTDGRWDCESTLEGDSGTWYREGRYRDGTYKYDGTGGYEDYVRGYDQGYVNRGCRK